MRWIGDYRVNGFETPLNSSQIAAWFVFFSDFGSSDFFGTCGREASPSVTFSDVSVGGTFDESPMSVASEGSVFSDGVGFLSVLAFFFLHVYFSYQLILNKDKGLH